jgi:uncharacterized membrane protein
MIYLWKIFYKITAVVGFLLLLFSLSISDYYALAMRQNPPENTDALIAWGAVLLIPFGIHLLCEFLKGGANDVHR